MKSHYWSLEILFFHKVTLSKKLSLMVIYSPGKCIDTNGRKKAGRDTNPSDIKRP